MLTALSYSANTADLLEQIVALPGAVFLDSGYPYSHIDVTFIVAASVILILVVIWMLILPYVHCSGGSKIFTVCRWRYYH